MKHVTRKAQVTGVISDTLISVDLPFFQRLPSVRLSNLDEGPLVMPIPTMNPTFAQACAVDAGNLACRKRGGNPSNVGCWPANEWNSAEYAVYHGELVRCWRMIDPQIAQAMEDDLIQKRTAVAVNRQPDLFLGAFS